MHPSRTEATRSLIIMTQSHGTTDLQMAKLACQDLTPRCVTPRCGKRFGKKWLKMHIYSLYVAGAGCVGATSPNTVHPWTYGYRHPASRQIPSIPGHNCAFSSGILPYALRDSLRLFHFATTDILSFVLRTRLRRLRFAPGKTFPAKWSPDFSFSRTRLSDNNSLLGHPTPERRGIRRFARRAARL